MQVFPEIVLIAPLRQYFIEFRRLKTNGKIPQNGIGEYLVSSEQAHDVSRK